MPRRTKTADHPPHRISAWQAGILDALADGKLAATAQILERMGVRDRSPTPAERATMSRSLRRLAERGLIERVEPEIARPGHGYLWRRAGG